MKMVEKAVAALTRIGAEKEKELIDAQMKNKALSDKVSPLEHKGRLSPQLWMFFWKFAKRP